MRSRKLYATSHFVHGVQVMSGTHFEDELPPRQDSFSGMLWWVPHLLRSLQVGVVNPPEHFDHSHCQFSMQVPSQNFVNSGISRGM